MSLPIKILVGGDGPYDPAPGATDVVIPELNGLEFYIGAPGYGPIPYTSYSPLSGGGFRMATPLADDTLYWVYITGAAYNSDSTGSYYTNGFNYNKVISALLHRVGWMQTPNSPVVNNSNLISRSGRKFNDGSFHSIVSLNTIKSTMEQVAASDADFNAFLESWTRATILRCVNGVFNEPELISQNMLYDRWPWGANDMELPNTGKFIGHMIKTPPRVDIATQIDSVALYFTEDVSFNLYLFNDIKKAPVFTIPVTARAWDQTIVDLTDVILNFIGDNNHGGIFYLGYFQNDLGTAKAIRENNICWKANMPFGSLSIEAEPISSNDFKRSNISYSNQSNGLNLHVSVFRDHTWQILKKPALFDNVIGLQMAAQVIEQSLFANRSNGTERMVKEGMDKVQAAMDLTGVAPISDGPPRTTGLRKQIEQELTRVKQSFFPKQKAMSVNIC